MMIIPVFILAFFFPPSDKPLSYDFGKDAGNDWRVIVDGVMGGLSTGNVAVLENSMVFTGSISLENNGGFSSLRAPFGKYDLSDYSAVEIRYHTHGPGCLRCSQTGRKNRKDDGSKGTRFRYSYRFHETG
jgi:hypothetical protein